MKTLRQCGKNRGVMKIMRDMIFGDLEKNENGNIAIEMNSREKRYIRDFGRWLEIWCSDLEFQKCIGNARDAIWDCI